MNKGFTAPPHFSKQTQRATNEWGHFTNNMLSFFVIAKLVSSVLAKFEKKPFKNSFQDLTFVRWITEVMV